MAEEPNSFSDLNERITKLACRSIITALAFKYLIADVATINRSPEQAKNFVENIKNQLNDFARYANDGDSDTDKLFLSEMLNYVELIFSGITFDRDRKS